MAMMDMEKVISELDTQIRWIEDIDAHKFPGWCGATMAMRYAMMLLKEQQEQIDHLLEESASNAEMAEGLKELLKEQEAIEPKTEITYNGFHYDYCGDCGRLLPVAQDFEKARFCPYCGRKVKWDA